MDFSASEIGTIAASVVFFILLTLEVLGVTHFSSKYLSRDCAYGYGQANGPHTWISRFPLSRGHHQSPINIISRSAICVPADTIPTLSFSSQYIVPPKGLKIYNDGHTVTLWATWPDKTRAHICGGPFPDTYNFWSLVFRWGVLDFEGSEHMIDFYRYAMEVQAIHVKAGCKFKSLAKAAENNALLIITYLYQVTPSDNCYLKHVIDGLRQIRTPFSVADIDANPLFWIMPPFTKEYYSYQGSLTHPPCTEGVMWIVRPHGLGISNKQLRQFRKLKSLEGYIDKNTRTVQELNDRDVQYYD